MDCGIARRGFERRRTAGIFADGGGSLYHNYQVSPGGTWSGWSFLAYGPMAQPPSVVEDADGTLQVFAVINNTVYVDQQTDPDDSSTWSGWIALSGASIATTPNAVVDYEGNVYIFAQGTDSAAWYNVLSAATGAWSGWSSLGGTIFGSPSAAVNVDGRVQIFVQGLSNQAWYNAQNDDLATWGGWVPMGGSIVTPPTVVANENGTLEIFSTGTDNAAWHNWQTTPGGDFYGWGSLGGYISTAVGAFRNIDGRLEIFAANGDSLFLNYQMSEEGVWSGWYNVGSSSDPVPTGSSAASYLGIGFRGGPPSTAEDDAYSNFFGSSNQSGVTPGQHVVGFGDGWPCTVVAVNFQGFTKNDGTQNKGWLKKLQRALDNWNKALAPKGQPVFFTTAQGDNLHSITVRRQQIVEDPPDTTVTNKTQGYTHLLPATKDANDQLLHVNIDINPNITNGNAIMHVLMHEIGHTFQLDDCHRCGTPDPTAAENFPTVMSSENVFQTGNASCKHDPASQACANVAVNFAQGPAAPSGPDVSGVMANNPSFSQCGNQASNQPVSCNDGTTPSVVQGFASDGTLGEPVASCDGNICDSCNPQCSSFSGGDCPSGGSSSGSHSCTQYCGSICMDGAVCSCAGEAPTCQENSGGYFPACESNCSPIIIDAYGEGFHLTDIADGVKFRANPAHPLLQMSWPSQQYHNAWLALDRNGNGTIDDFTELFGNMTSQPMTGYPNGYLALAVFDQVSNGGNGNGVIDPGDSVYSQLLLWIDANHNGISEPGELHGLSEMGIFRINLSFSDSSYVDANGNSFRYKSYASDQTGANSYACYDVFLSVQPILVPGGN